MQVAPYASPANSRTISQHLECGEVVWYPTAPFALPEGDDLAFLLKQDLGRMVHKNISYNPHTDKATGFARGNASQGERLREILATFSKTVTAWLEKSVPHYARGWELDRVSYRPVEEATRRARTTARNDLLHVDAFPGRPAHGRRILRVFANINPSEPRVWVTSESLEKLLVRYRDRCEASTGRLRRILSKVIDYCKPPEKRRSASDTFMIRFHDYLKRNSEFQHRTARKLWHFPPGSVWLAMTDGCSHAVLRGRFALEHSYWVAPETLLMPHLSPVGLLEGKYPEPVVEMRRAA